MRGDLFGFLHRTGKAVVDCLLSIEPSLNVHPLRHLLAGIARAFDIDVIEGARHLIHLVGHLAHVFGVADNTAPGIVDHDETGFGDADLVACHCNHRGDRGSDAVNVSDNAGRVLRQKVIHGEPVEYVAAIGVDAQVDRLGRTKCLEIVGELLGADTAKETGANILVNKNLGFTRALGTNAITLAHSFTYCSLMMFEAFGSGSGFPGSGSLGGGSSVGAGAAGCLTARPASSIGT